MHRPTTARTRRSTFGSCAGAALAFLTNLLGAGAQGRQTFTSHDRCHPAEGAPHRRKPYDAKLLNGRARNWCGWRSNLAKQHGVTQRQSYTRVGKFALILHQRFAPAKEFKRANRKLKNAANLSGPGATRPQDKGRLAGLEAAFGPLLMLARRVARAAARSTRAKGFVSACAESRMHRQGQDPPAFRVRRQGLGRHHDSHVKGKQFVTHVKAIRMTVTTVIPEFDALFGNTIIPSHASWPSRATTATMRRPTTSSESSLRSEV